jgi:hypothetical protein
LKFCGKLISSGKYVVNLCINYFQQKQPISPVEIIDDTIYDDNQDDIHDEIEDTQTKSPSFLNTIKTTISNSYYNVYYRIFGKYHPNSQDNYTTLPLYNNSSELQDMSKDIKINSYSKNQDYSSLLDSHKYSLDLNKNDDSLYDKNSEMFQTIPLNHSGTSEIKKPIERPYGLNRSSLLFESSFINNKLSKKELPFAINSFYATLHPLQEINDNEQNEDNGQNENNQNEKNDQNENDSNDENGSEHYEECE